MPSRLVTATVLGCSTLAASFNAAPLTSSTPARATACMTAPDVIAKKSAVVDEVVATMEKSALMFAVRSEGIKPNDMNMMRQKFPEEVTIRCVKNTLMKRASDKVEKFQGGEDMYEYSNYWCFVPEEHLRVTVDTWNDWVKETKVEENEIIGGVFEGERLDPKGIIAVTKLPTKQELMQNTAIVLKKKPQKLASALNQAGAQRIAKVTNQAAGQKLVQAVKQVEGKLE